MRSRNLIQNTSAGPANANGMRRARYLLEHGRQCSLPKARLRLGWHPPQVIPNGSYARLFKLSAVQSNVS